MTEDDGTFKDYMDKCASIARELFPEIKGDDVYDLLWEFTSYPFYSLDVVEQQLHELKERRNDTT